MNPYRSPHTQATAISTRGPRLTGWRRVVHLARRALLWLRVGAVISARRAERRSMLAIMARTARDIQRRIDDGERVSRANRNAEAHLAALLAREGGPWPKPCARCGMTDRHSYACDSDELRDHGFIRGPALDDARFGR